MTTSFPGLSTRDRRQLAHFEMSVQAFEFFRAKDTPITQHEARRMAFAAYLVYRQQLSEWPQQQGNPSREWAV